MSETEPKAAEAQAALTLARNQAAHVRVADRQFRWVLLAIAAMYVAVGAIVSLTPHHGSTVAGVGVVLVAAAMLMTIIVIAVRIRAYSRAGILGFILTACGFTVWNAIVSSVSIGTRFWAADQPSYHFGLSVLVAVIPLVFGAWLIGRLR